MHDFWTVVSGLAGYPDLDSSEKLQGNLRKNSADPSMRHSQYTDLSNVNAHQWSFTLRNSMNRWTKPIQNMTASFCIALLCLHDEALGRIAILANRNHMGSDPPKLIWTIPTLNTQQSATETNITIQYGTIVVSKYLKQVDFSILCGLW